jgi:hypothetical protein
MVAGFYIFDNMVAGFYIFDNMGAGFYIFDYIVAGFISLIRGCWFLCLRYHGG